MQRIIKPVMRRPMMPLLVILQVALACAIACNALFLLQQKLAPILASDGVGDPAHLIFLHDIVARGTPWSAERMRGLEAELVDVPGVSSVSYAASLPMVSASQVSADVYGMNAGSRVNVTVYFGDDLVKSLGLRLVAGRDFTPEERAGTLDSGMGFNSGGPVIVTRALADRLYPDGNAIGHPINYSDSNSNGRIIVGVVEHLMRNKFLQGGQSLDYTMLFPGVPQQWSLPMFAVRLKTSEIQRVCPALVDNVKRDLGADILPGNEVACDTYQFLRSEMLGQTRAAVWLLSGVTLIVLIVTLTGIVGMTTYWVQQRTKQIGIRRALGARRHNIVHELLTENLLIVGAGLLLGLPSAIGVNLWLMHHYELLRLPMVYLPAGAALLLILIQIGVLAPALRASMVPPAVATRGL